MVRVSNRPLRFEDRAAVLAQITKVKAIKADRLKEFDQEIARLQAMLDTGMVPQTCG